MARRDRYLKIRTIHRALPWSDIDVVSASKEFVKDKCSSGATDYLDRLLQRGASVATFEIYSACWFLPDDTPLDVKYSLSIASVVSAAAIIEIDHLVDGSMQHPIIPHSLLGQARTWGDVTEATLGIRTNWGSSLLGWSRANHGITATTPAGTIPLRKNPFYVLVANAYTRNTTVPGRLISKLYTTSLGIIDDILDLVDDFLEGRPNVVLSTLRLPPGASVDDLLFEVFSRDALRKYCQLSIRHMQRAKALAVASQCQMLAGTCQIYEEKFGDFLLNANESFILACAESRPNFGLASP